MTKKVKQFCISALLYWLVAMFAGQILEMPAKIVSIAVFIPPVLGLMWGLPAALGVYAGASLVIPELQSFYVSGNWLFHFVRTFWVFLAGYLPYFLWRRWLISSEEPAFSLSVFILRKFILIMLATFVVTSIFRTLTATDIDLKLVEKLLDSRDFTTTPFKNAFMYFLVCFVNDFFISIFFDLAIFFFLVTANYPFYGYEIKPVTAQEDKSFAETGRSLIISLVFYMLFPLSGLYVDKFQIYGLDNMETWMPFVTECLTIVDIYLVMMLYLLLRYRRSIMLEVVFLVTQTVFLSSAVLGLGSSLAIGNIVNNHTNESLHEMSIICRERLYRTFFSVRQAVNGMSLQAVNSIESYERLAGDAEYRKSYLDEMKREFTFDAVGIDGSISFYLRLIPEIEGTQGGFSMQREDARWEGALSPFLEREPIDLAPYDPDDAQTVGWYYLPFRNHAATWIEPYVDVITHFYVISYVAPMYLDGKFIGVVGMDIDFNFIIQELRRMSIYDYGYVYIMDRSNRVLYHKDQPQGELFQPNPDYQEIEVYLANGMWLGIATPLSKVNDARNKMLMHFIAAVLVVAMIISVISITLASRAIKPLAGMTEAAKRIASGDLNVKISYESGNELGILVKSIREMASKLVIYVYRDKLTGLRNAAAYISKATDLDAQSKIVPEFSYGVIIFDANFLKKVNDNYGHDAGNELLRHAGKVIREVFSESNVYRIGGDEFAAILEGEDYENRQALLDLFDEKVAQEHFDAAGDTLTLSIARGLGIYKNGMTFAEVSKSADVAMYANKIAIKSKFGEEVR